ncbi:MAG: TonB-dependent receptor [Bacteroidaceae bacterium]|nr:TonB-dependent receptor [Bacteroidaceae bacterium]
MGKLLIAILMLLLTASHTAQAQTRHKPEKGKTEAKKKPDKNALNIRGTVYENETLQPLEGATIRLYKQDSTMVGGHTSAKNGDFLLENVRQDIYVLKVSFMGFKTQSFKLDLTDKKGNFKTQDILMREEEKMMAEAVVSGQMPEMTVVEDTVMYNADAFALPEGSMVEDLVKRLPGMVEEEDGSLTWNGKAVSQILVDGKEFFGNNRELVMKNLPADIIDKVKAYDRQSDLARVTGIDDGNEKTVLDLAIKKNKKKGWFGQLEGGYGTSDRYHGRTNVNRFEGKQKFSIIGNANNTRGDGMTDRQEGGANFSVEKKNVEADGSLYADFGQGSNDRTSNSQSFVRKSYSNSASTSSNRNRNMGFNFKLEWEPDSMTDINFRPNFSMNGSESTSRSANATFNDNPYAVEGITDPLLQMDKLAPLIGVNHRRDASFNENDRMNGSASIQINRKLRKKGRNITLNANGGFSKGETNRDSYNQVDYYKILALTGEDSIYHKTQYNESLSKNWNVGGRLSYTEPVGDQMFIQMSYNYSYRFTDNDRNVSSIFDPMNAQLGVGLGNYRDFREHGVLDQAQCNYTTNTYQNHNVDLQYRIVRTKYRLTAGVNVQPQINSVDYTKGYKSYDVTRHVVNASPTVNFRYRFSKLEQLRIRYGGSTGQPGITDLIPDTLSNANPLNIRLGNPGLKPSFTQNMRVDYQKSIPALQRAFSADLQYMLTQNSVTNKTEYNEETGGRITQPENVNGNWSARAGFNFNTAFKGDQRFRMSTSTSGSMTNAVGYVYQSKAQATIRNKTKGMHLDESARFTFHDKNFEANVKGSIRYNHSRSTSSSASDLDTYVFSYGGEAVWKLPWRMSLSTDIQMRSRRGYADANMNTDQLLWNVQLSQSFLKQRNLILTVRAYDLLNQRDEVSRRITESARTDSRSAMVHQYVVCSLMYRFGKFGGKGGKKKEDKKKDGPEEMHLQPAAHHL